MHEPQIVEDQQRETVEWLKIVPILIQSNIYEQFQTEKLENGLLLGKIWNKKGANWAKISIEFLMEIL